MKVFVSNFVLYIMILCIISNVIYTENFGPDISQEA
jgi:hypothetical protein